MASGGLAPRSEAAGGSEEVAVSDAAVAALPESIPAAMAMPAAAPRALGAVAAQFPVRLLSTLPNAQPPRAVLGLPDGTEVVVSPGTVLGNEGLVVMSVMPGRVQLAQVRPAGDHAVIESVELSAQYP